MVMLLRTTPSACMQVMWQRLCSTNAIVQFAQSVTLPHYCTAIADAVAIAIVNNTTTDS
jgi:hypothetical protein